MKKYTLILIAFTALSAYAAEPLKTLEYYQQQEALLTSPNSREERAWAKSLADGLGTWVKQNPSNTNAPQALLAQARLYLQAQDKARALIALLTVKKLYPQVDMGAYQNMISEALTAVNEPARNTEGTKAFAAGTVPAETPDREASILFALSKLPGRNVYEPATVLFENFFVKNPNYAKNDQVELWYGDLHRVNGNYLSAIAQYKKATALYPNTPYRAASMRLIGDIYADNLKDTPNAMAMYTQVLRDYPNSNETGVVYKHMAILEENNKNFDSALINYDKAIELLGATDSGYEAYRGKADVYTKTRNYEDAYNMLHQTANAFVMDQNKHTEALVDAANVAKKRLHDDTKYTQSLEKALFKFPSNNQSAEIMYNLAQTYEKQDKKIQAMDMYKRLILAHPADKYASKAQGRLQRLEK